MVYMNQSFHLLCLLQAKHHSLPPVSLQGQLLWREFFYTVASATPNFTKMAGNPICLQISWYEDAERLHKWKTVTRCIATTAVFQFSFSIALGLVPAGYLRWGLQQCVGQKCNETVSGRADVSFLLQAQTGFPWIDAIMTQLRQEGWIHHLARHAVACFLTRGDLWISWEEGMKVHFWVFVFLALRNLEKPLQNVSLAVGGGTVEQCFITEPC